MRSNCVRSSASDEQATEPKRDREKKLEWKNMLRALMGKANEKNFE